MTSNEGDKKSDTKERESRVTVDAGHPRFVSQIAEDFSNFCPQCNVRFGRSVDSVRQHFRNQPHSKFDSCVYCGTAVFVYLSDGKRAVFHECRSCASPQCQQIQNQNYD